MHTVKYYSYSLIYVGLASRMAERFPLMSFPLSSLGRRSKRRHSSEEQWHDTEISVDPWTPPQPADKSIFSLIGFIISFYQSRLLRERGWCGYRLPEWEICRLAGFCKDRLIWKICLSEANMSTSHSFISLFSHSCKWLGHSSGLGQFLIVQFNGRGTKTIL